MKLILFILPIFLSAESFISNLEYGKMLYNNPRGISCAKCHGKSGEGRIIAIYINDKTGKEEKLIAPNIAKVSYKIFFNKVKNSKILKNGKFKKLNYSFMPKYDYLTEDEVKSIYNYLHKGKK
jgi:hypothetical protein